MDEVEFCVLIDNEPVVVVASSRERSLSAALKQDLPHGVPLSAIKFYRLQQPVPVGSPYELDNTQLLQACTAGGNRTPIQPWKMRVGELAPELSISYVYLVADLPVVPQKRTAEQASLLDRVRSAKIGKLAPFSLNFETYKSLQADLDQRILDDHFIAGIKDIPLNDQVPPIPLVYRPFGIFIDAYLDAGREVPSTLKEQVDDFADQMTQIHDDEDVRRDAALPCLNRIFSEAFGAGVQAIAPASIGKYRSDGHVLGPRNTPIFLVELKNEETNIRSLPIAELCAYYYQLVTRVDDTLKLSSRIPALGLTIVGPVITFYAVAFIGRVHYTALTSSISCVYRAVNGDDRQKLYKAFAATFNVVRRITQDACSTPPLSPLKNPLYPAITELPSFEDPNVSIKFEIIEPIVVTTGRYLYLATSSSTTMLMIKFTSRYSTDLHGHCFRQGHAPVLRGYGRLPGNILGIAMEFVDKAKPLGPKEGSADERKDWADQLARLVESFHGAGYVHGDLRCPNILITEDSKVMLIDYDWGGKEGEAFYPHGKLNPQLAEGRKGSDLMIRKEDDERVLAITLNEIGIGSQS